MAAVNRILSDLGLSEKQQMVVFNKIDRVDPEELDVTAFAPGAHAISALAPKTMAGLLLEIDKKLFFSERSAVAPGG